MTTDPLTLRHETAVHIVDAAAHRALEFFRSREKLDIAVKGLQDWVSNADKSVEDQIRAALIKAFPNDAVIGEEHGNLTGTSGYTWVIDPIDGTTNFVNGTPGWCVVLACVLEQQSVIAVIQDPVANEVYSAVRGQGAVMNGQALSVSSAVSLDQGTLGVGHSTRVPAQHTVELLQRLLDQGGLFRRGGSGALDLAYVAAGRLIGYVEPHMNAWDCLAALLLVEEANGCVEPFNMAEMIQSGGQVVVACPGIYDTVRQMTEQSYKN